MIASIFQGLGRMLVECFLPDLAAKIRNEADGSPAREAIAVRRHIGLAYDELADRVAGLWGFPPELRRTMIRPSGPVPSQPVRDRFDSVRWTAAAGNEFAEAWFRGIASQSGEIYRNTALRYQGFLRLSPDEVGQAGQRARLAFLRFSEAFGLSPSDPSSVWALFLDPAQRDPLRPAARAGLAGKAGVVRYPQTHDTPAAESSGDRSIGALLAQGIEDFSNALAESESRAALIPLCLEVFYRALGARRGLVCLRVSGEHRLVGVVGIGTGMDKLKRAFSLSIDPGSQTELDLFGMLLKMGRDSWIDDLASPKLQARLPDWYRPLQPVGGKIVVLPLMRAHDVMGMIYLEDPDVGTSAMTDGDRKLLRALKQMMVMALVAPGP